MVCVLYSEWVNGVIPCSALLYNGSTISYIMDSISTMYNVSTRFHSTLLLGPIPLYLTLPCTKPRPNSTLPYSSAQFHSNLLCHVQSLCPIPLHLTLHVHYLGSVPLHLTLHVQYLGSVPLHLTLPCTIPRLGSTPPYSSCTIPRLGSTP